MASLEFLCLAAATASAAAGHPAPAAGHPAPAPLERIRVSEDGRGFVLAESGTPFRPWGFNYDHDEDLRLIEDYWDAEWAKVAEDFREMKRLGANVVRIHLQLPAFLQGPDRPKGAALERLGRLVALAERTRLYLDVTGLGCYRKGDVPDWYDRLGEAERWAAQARFWAAVASRSAASPAIFCYDLMNEPVVPGSRRKPGAWLGPPFAGRYHYVQFVTLDPAGRPRAEIARAWIRRLTKAVREHDRHHLITVGLVPWSLDRPGLSSGFVPGRIAPELDFVSVHLYPEGGRVAEALDTLKGFSVGKPVVIEETFPLRSPLPAFRRFLHESRALASGWIGFYWGMTPEACRRSGEIRDKLMLGWLELFQSEAESFRAGPP